MYICTLNKNNYARFFIVDGYTVKHDKTYPWLDLFNEGKYKGWSCTTDMSGTLYWTCPGAPGFTIHATPNWEDCDHTPVDYSTAEGVYESLGKIDKIDFKDFEEYTAAMEPFLNQILTEDETTGCIFE